MLDSVKIFFKEHNPFQEGPYFRPELMAVTPYHELGSDTPPHNPELARLAEKVTELTDVGLVSKSELEGVTLRIGNSSSPTPEHLKEAEHQIRIDQSSSHVVARIERENQHTNEGLFHSQTSLLSAEGVRAIHIDEPYAVSTKLGGNREETMDTVMFHELGHALAPTRELSGRIADVLKSDVSMPAEQAAKIDSAVFAASHQGFDQNSKLMTTLSESYADSFKAVAILATQGEAAAIADIDRALVSRQKDMDFAVDLADMLNPQARISDSGGHNTSEALLLLRESIVSGDAAAALDAGQGRELILEVTAHGYLNHYDNVRFADMNVHHLDLDSGKLVPGLPEGVSKEQVLSMDATARQLECRPAEGMTVLVSSDIMSALGTEATLGGKSLIGSSELEGFQAFSMRDTSFEIAVNGSEEPSIALQGISATQAYLANHEASFAAYYEPAALNAHSLFGDRISDYEPETNPVSVALAAEHAAKDEQAIEEASMDI